MNRTDGDPACDIAARMPRGPLERCRGTAAAGNEARRAETHAGSTPHGPAACEIVAYQSSTPTTRQTKRAQKWVVARGAATRLLFPQSARCRCCSSCSPPRAAAAALVPALFVFGDSLVDDGNNNALPGALARADYYPYGIDFPPRGAATGRFCNGKTVVDALCDLLGIQYVPPYTSPGLNGTALLGGVNYASAAGGILDDTGYHLGDRFSLNQQVLNFETNLDAIRSLFGDDRSSYEQYLARSVAVMVLGSNDYINNYLLTPLYDSGDRYSPEGYAGLLLDHYTRQILALYGVGLKKFLLAGVGPLGCIPSLRASGLAPRGQCVDQVNQIVGFFNQGLRSLLDQLNADHPDAAFVYGNTYAATQDMIDNPSKYGFTAVDSGCCGLGQNRGQVTCLPFVVPCDDRGEYVFWDAYHPTQAANLVLAQRTFNGTQDHVYPVNLQQLAKL